MLRRSDMDFVRGGRLCRVLGSTVTELPGKTHGLCKLYTAIGVHVFFACSV